MFSIWSLIHSNTLSNILALCSTCRFKKVMYMWLRNLILAAIKKKNRSKRQLTRTMWSKFKQPGRVDEGVFYYLYSYIHVIEYPLHPLAVNGYLNCFHILAIINKAVIALVHVSLELLWFFFFYNIYPRVKF